MCIATIEHQYSEEQKTLGLLRSRLLWNMHNLHRLHIRNTPPATAQALKWQWPQFLARYARTL